MTWAHEVAAATVLAGAAPLAVWAERRVKAWTQLRTGPGFLQPYRDLRRLWIKQPLAPEPASPLYFAAPVLGVSIVVAALLLMPLYSAGAGLGGGAALVMIGLLLTLHRALLAAQAFDGATAFGGMGASRELFLGGLGEPVLFLVAAAVFLQTGGAGFPERPLDASDPATWLVAAALGFWWLAETARIPFDNPATHLELTMVHEATVLESSGWMLALQEAASWARQMLLSAVLLLLLVPLPHEGFERVGLLLLGALLLSAILALVESAMAKVRLFRASHLLVMAALLAFLAGAVEFLGRAPK